MGNSQSQNLSQNRLLAIQIFEENIIPHILGDLNILDEIQLTTHENSCAVPTAMLILGSLDFIGYLLRESGNKNESEKNLTTAFNHKKYFPEELYNSEVIKNMTIIFRHGVMHSFFPNQKNSHVYGVHKLENDKLFEVYRLYEKQIFSLNVNLLSKHFKLFVFKLYKEIQETNDPGILENFSKSYSYFYPSNLSKTITSKTTIPIGVRKNK